MQKMAVICRGNTVFIDDLIDHWRNKYQFVNNMHEADVIWVEWGNEQSIQATCQSLKKNVIVRVHGSEYFQDFWKHWGDKLHTVITTNPYYTFENKGRRIFLPVAIDTSFWQNSNIEQIESGSLAIIGNLEYSKGHIPLLRMLSEYPTKFGTIYIVGKREHEDVAKNIVSKKIEHICTSMGKRYQLNIKWIDFLPKDKLRDLYHSVEFVVSNSTNEGCHTVIQEAMACGCKVLVADWMGADILFPDDVVFKNSREFWNIADNYPLTCVDILEWARTNFDKELIFKKMNEIIEEVLHGQ
jgi:glycosyltransferase involved in cell wall biosynthesis